MGVETSSDTAHALGAVIGFITVTSNLRQFFIDRIVFDIMGLILQRICISFDLCIEGTQVLACRVVCRDIGQCLARFCNGCIIIVKRLAGYKLVGVFSGNSSRQRTSAKSLAPGVFIGLLLVCCCIGFRDGFPIITNCISLQIRSNIRCVGLGIRLQLFHDDDIMGIFAVSGFDETVVIRGVISICFCSRRSCIIIPRAITIL